MKKKKGTGFAHSMNVRKARLIIEWVYIGITVVITILAILAFFFQDNVIVIYPIIFGLAAGMNVLSGVRYLGRDHKNKIHPVAAVFCFILAGLLIALAVIGIIILF